MATRLFFHDAANALSGTFPTTEQSTVGTPTKTVVGANTLRTMGSLTGTAMVTRSLSGSVTVAQQILMCGFFASMPLDVDQQIPPQPTTLNIANRESSTNMNLGADLRAVAYVWRPSAGTMVGYITDGLVGAGDAEPSTSLSIRVNNCSVTSTVTVSAAAGDVIICEVWQVFTQATANAFTGAFYYDGTTVNVTTNSTVTNHASFYELSTSTLTFAQPPITGTFTNTLSAATLAAAGAVAIAGSGNISCAAATVAATGRVAVSSARSITLAAATVAATGTVAGPFTFGNRSATLTDATVAATGKVAVAGVGGISCADATIAATGVLALAASRSVTLDTATVAATGTVVDGASGPVGARSITLDSIIRVTSGVLGPTPLVSAPILPSDNSGGSGASRSNQRKMFRIPDLTVEPEKTLEDMLGIRKEPVPIVVPVEEPIRRVRTMTLAEAVAASPPAITPTLPKPSPVVVEEEEYSDDDLIQLLLMVSP